MVVRLNIDLRHVKCRVKRCLLQLLGECQLGEIERLAGGQSRLDIQAGQETLHVDLDATSFAEVAPPAIALCHRSILIIRGSHNVSDVCEVEQIGEFVRKSAKCNLKMNTAALGDINEKNEAFDESNNQVLTNDVATGDNCAKSYQLGDIHPPALKLNIEAKTASSVNKILYSESSSKSKIVPSEKGLFSCRRMIKDTRSSYYLPQQMPEFKYTSQDRGIKLDIILQQIHDNHGDIRELDFTFLAKNDKCLDAEGCNLAARSLSTNHTVSKLVIQDHAIGDDGAEALAKMLCRNTTLEYVDLHGNFIGDRGAKALAQALYGHDSLRHLCLSNNIVTDCGASALAEAIRCNCTLTSLNLTNNQIKKVGSEALLHALDVNMHLEGLYLEANDVPAFVVSQLAAALARNRAESLILESHAAEKEAEKMRLKACGLDTEMIDIEMEKNEVETWDDDDSDSASSGFLSCSGLTDVPLSSSGSWI